MAEIISLRKNGEKQIIGTAHATERTMCSASRFVINIGDPSYFIIDENGERASNEVFCLREFAQEAIHG